MGAPSSLIEPTLPGRYTAATSATARRVGACDTVASEMNSYEAPRRFYSNRRSWSVFSRARILVPFLAVVLVSAQDQSPLPTFRTEANYVRVDVFPTKNGAPILDLKQEDFEILESGTPQRIEQFEHILIRGGGAQSTLVEPNTVRDSRAMLASTRARVFVVFLDVGHVTVAGSHHIRQPLTTMLDRLVGPDDVVGVMTPDMSPTDIAFGRKTTTIEDFLSRHWYWGESQQIQKHDPVEQNYEACFVLSPGIAAEMIERRRAKQTLNALQDLVRFLRGVREERKAIVAISDGFRLFTRDLTLMRPLDGQVPTGAPIVVDPRSGKLSTRDTNNPAGASYADCDRDRMFLAQLDQPTEFRQMLDEANYANASFYPVDPRGLEVFDSPIDDPLPLQVDRARIDDRITMLRTLAENTDGLAVVNTNDLGGMIKRVVDDLSNYYLLGYYSTGKLDGRFHSITVRVKRPGVQVRARKGYLAATPASAKADTAARAAAATPVKADVETLAVASAIAPLNGFARELPIRLQATAGWKPDNTAAVWMVGEGTGDEWKAGGEADVILTTGAGATVAAAHAIVPAGARTFRVALSPTTVLVPGDYVVRVRARGGAALGASNDVLRIALPASPDATGALYVRRGPTTGNREVPTADLRFRRSEQLRVEMPSTTPDAVHAQLLDRTGKALSVPVTTATRDDADGSHWQTAQIALAPLAPGDYVIAWSDASGDVSKRTLLAFRVIP
jgi:VWFA-related protein